MSKIRCDMENCNKKIKLTDFRCRCKLIFCVKHRHAEEHKCSYDYISEGKYLLQISNIKLESNKIMKI